MYICGRNVTKEYLINNEIINNIYLQENFSDQEVLRLIEKKKYNVKIVKKYGFEKLTLKSKALVDATGNALTSFLAGLETVKAEEKNMLKSGKELKVFAVRDQDLAKFCDEAKKYGVLYSMPVSDLLTFLVALVLIVGTYRELNQGGKNL